MEVKHLLLFILFHRTITARIFSDEEDPAYSRSAFFETKQNKRLYGHVSKRFESRSLISCTRSCLETDWCSSTNFKVSSKDEDNGTCELNEHSIIDENTEFNNEEGVTFSMPTQPCQSPCRKNGACAPDSARNTYRCVCKPGFAGARCEVCKFDFEDGIEGWQKTGTAFNNQPTYGDNPTARRSSSPANQQRDWWIGGYEDRPSKETPPGRSQGNDPKGTLTSPPFTVIGKNISFLIGGACNEKLSRAELIVNSLVVRKAASRFCTERMTRTFWDVAAFIGQRARVKLVDLSSIHWGHINFDDLRGDISCE